MRLISLFTGAGGLDLGLEAAGFETAVAVEHDADAVRTLRANRPGWTVLETDIHAPHAAPAKLLAVAGLQPREATLLAGGPPCQPFSKSGYWHRGESRRLDDPRARTLDAYLAVLREALPEVFLLENVPGLAFNAKAEGITFIRDQIEAINRDCGVRYTVCAAQLNAAAYGVPQLRQRVFLVGHREGQPFDFPAPTHTVPPPVSTADGTVKASQLELTGQPLPPCRTAWDALGHLEVDGQAKELQATGKWAALLASIPEGHNYLFHTERGGGLPLFGWRTRYWSMLLKLSKRRPSWTITAQPGPAIGPFHWDSRRLSRQELAALQTFPSDYTVVGSHRSAQRQLGNAVPSALAHVVGHAIRRQLLGHDLPPLGESPLLPAVNGTVPKPRPACAVTHPPYLAMVGPHAAHPGTGRGPGAQRRKSEPVA